MLQTVGKFGIIITLSVMVFLGIDVEIYGAFGALAMAASMIMLLDQRDRARRTTTMLLKDSAEGSLDFIYILAVCIFVGLTWPALPLIAVFGGDDTDARPDPSGPRVR